ncbi:MAG: alpha/beta fold hydrolase [Lentisphaeria bacterium]
MKIEFPSDWQQEPWYNGTRHIFSVDGVKAWIVEPHQPVGDGRWTWCLIWPESSVQRVGVPEYLDRGFYHAHIEAHPTYATSDKGMPLLRKFYQQCVALGLSCKVHLMGLSWGGFFSLRFASENPEKVACIYLDAPLCNMADESTKAMTDAHCVLQDAYHLSNEEMLSSSLNPINALKPIAEAGIPIFAVTGEDDLVVPVQHHINIVEERFLALGGKITICRRNSWGHHPHGLDERSELITFMVDNAGKYCYAK